ncbi:hypothetical protein KR074_012343, partial [Drosophila pseudoananassae]
VLIITMKIFAALVFFMALGLSQSIDISSEKLSPRVFVASVSRKHPITTNKLAADLAKSWLKDLGLFNLQSQIRQAKHMKTGKPGVLFELKTAVQAKEVVLAWTSPIGKEVQSLKGLSAEQTTLDFFQDFPKS